MKAVPDLPRRPRAILFDFDGVIVDSTNLKTDAFVAVYYGEPAHKQKQVREYQEDHGGIGRRDKFFYFESVLFNRPPSPHRLDVLCAEFGRRVDEQLLQVPMVNGAAQALADLAGKTRMHLVSGMPQKPLHSVVHQRGLAQYFDSVVGSPTEKLEAFGTILANAALAADDCLAIGDSTTEFEAALKLGMPFLAVVPPDTRSPFPAGVETLDSLEGLSELLGW